MENRYMRERKTVEAFICVYTNVCGVLPMCCAIQYYAAILQYASTCANKLTASGMLYAYNTMLYAIFRRVYVRFSANEPAGVECN